MREMRGPLQKLDKTEKRILHRIQRLEEIGPLVAWVGYRRSDTRHQPSRSDG
jgi:hypothetical protein